MGLRSYFLLKKTSAKAMKNKLTSLKTISKAPKLKTVIKNNATAETIAA